MSQFKITVKDIFPGLCGHTFWNLPNVYLQFDFSLFWLEGGAPPSNQINHIYRGLFVVLNVRP